MELAMAQANNGLTIDALFTIIILYCHLSYYCCNFYTHKQDLEKII